VKELHDLETYEVSLVPKGANGKQFLVFKNLKGKQGMTEAQKIVDWVSKNQDPKVLERVMEVLKTADPAASPSAPAQDPGGAHAGPPMALSDKARAGLQAIARIAGPMKDEVHPMHLLKVLHAAGYEGMAKAMDVFGNPDGEVHNPDGESPSTLHDSSLPLQKIDMKDIPQDVLGDMRDVLKSGGLRPKLDDDEDDEDDVSDEDIEKAKVYPEGEDAAILKVFKAHMSKASKYAMKAYKEYMGKLGYRKYPDAEVRMKGVRKDIKQVDIGDIAHDDTEERGMDVHKSLDLSKVDPKLRPALEQIFKGQRELVEKANKLEKDNAKLRDDARQKEFVEKAASIGIGAKTEDLAKILKGMADVNPALADQLEAILKGASTQIKKSALFDEFGSTNESKRGGDAYGKIEALADSLVQKSADKLSKSEAIEQVLKTAEGKALYNEYMSAKPNMKV
jgi:hypothetical protein